MFRNHLARQQIDSVSESTYTRIVDPEDTPHTYIPQSRPNRKSVTQISFAINAGKEHHQKVNISLIASIADSW